MKSWKKILLSVLTCLSMSAITVAASACDLASLMGSSSSNPAHTGGIDSISPPSSSSSSSTDGGNQGGNEGGNQDGNDAGFQGGGSQGSTLIHTHNYTTTVVPPTCTEQGYTQYYCAGCLDSYQADFVAPKNHSGGTATCTTQAICGTCSQPYGELEKHVYVEKVTANNLAQAATCESQPLYYKICECGAQDATQTFASGTKLEHAYQKQNWTWTDYASATLTFVCANDASHTIVQNAVITSKTTQQSSCSSTGEKTHTATVTFEGVNYSDTKTETVSAGHSYENGACTSCGAAYFSQGLVYTKYTTNGGEYGVTGLGTCTDTDIYIPATYENLPVTKIANYAFNGKSTLTSVHIPATLTSFGNSAFSNCSNLKGVYISSLESWLTSTFADEKANPLYYAKNLYLDGELVTNLVVPTTSTQIPTRAFINATCLTKVTLHDGVTNIGGSAFKSASKLTAVDVESLEGFFKITYGGNYANPLATAQKLYVNGEQVTDIIVPETITAINNYALQQAASIVKVTLHNNITSIGQYAFTRCTGLTEIYIPEGVTRIAEHAFSFCSNLADITISDNVSYIGTNAFASTKYYSTSSNWTHNVLYIGKYLIIAKDFDLISGTYSVHEGTLCIANRALENQPYLTGLVMPNSLKYIGNGAFNCAYALTSVSFGDGLLTIGDDAFTDCRELTSLELPDNLQSIGASAFIGCEKLSSVDFGEQLQVLGDSSFGGCTALTSVILPDSLISIVQYAFSNCTALESIVVGYGLRDIGDSAFGGCSKLAKIYYKGTPEMWATININQSGGGNYKLNTATKYYYSEEGALDTTNKYWYYNGDVPTAW